MTGPAGRRCTGWHNPAGLKMRANLGAQADDFLRQDDAEFRDQAAQAVVACGALLARDTFGLTSTARASLLPFETFAACNAKAEGSTSYLEAETFIYTLPEVKAWRKLVYAMPARKVVTMPSMTDSTSRS